jgi:hypothetical protein
MRPFPDRIRGAILMARLQREQYEEMPHADISRLVDAFNVAIASVFAEAVESADGLLRTGRRSAASYTNDGYSLVMTVPGMHSWSLDFDVIGHDRVQWRFAQGGAANLTGGWAWLSVDDLTLGRVFVEEKVLELVAKYADMV